MVQRRQELAAMYDERLAGHAVVKTPVVSDAVSWNVQTYSVRLPGWSAEERDAVMQHMLDAGVASRAGVMTAHREPAYADFDVKLPFSEQASDSSLVMPLYTGMDESDVDECVAALLSAVEHVCSGR